jgi:uncharacterized membrane protein YczE
MPRPYRSFAWRIAVLIPALTAMGLGIALMAQSGLGLAPWQVFHQGIARQTGLALGTVTILVGIPVLVAWLPLGQRPGIGTVLNVLIVGTATNLGLSIIPAPTELAPRVAEMLLGVAVIGVGSGIYLAMALGPGPRDGIMTGIHRRFGWSIARTRTGIEIIVLIVGMLMGGTFGVGTILYAFGVGQIVQAVLRVLDREGRVMLRPGATKAMAGFAPPGAGATPGAGVIAGDST